MKEIEIKAHVYNREEVISILNSLPESTPLGTTEKSDVYYHIPLTSKKSKAHKKDKSAEKNHISVRFRTEIENDSKKSIVFTYKQKEVLVKADGSSIEVNDENECTVSDSVPFIKMIEALGGTVSLEKHKSVIHWQVISDGFSAHTELCTVPPLGDFLEIEIISESAEEDLVNAAKTAEEKILTLCNIPLSQIEPRYYREMLNKVANNSD